jgi:citrate synthase
MAQLDMTDVMSADEAAAELGISVRTLYSYVSRKQVRSATTAGDGKRRVYAGEDIRRLKSSARLTGVAAPRSTLVDQSAITEVTPRGHLYRGRSAIELSETETLESVGELLLEAPGVFDQPAPILPEAARQLIALTPGLSTADQAITLFPLLEGANPKSYDLSPIGFARTSVDLVRYFSTISTHGTAPSEEPTHRYIIRSLGADPAMEDILRRTLVLMADHDLDPTTYAVRAIANTGATPYHAAMVGLAAFRGRRLQFGRTELVNHLLEEIVGSPDPARPVVRAFRHDEPMLGFGSIVYGDYDPRADTLLHHVLDQLGDEVAVQRLAKAIEVGREILGKGPSVTLMISFIRNRLGMPASDSSFMANARIVGWCAHAMEQYHGRTLFRPRSL